METNSTLPTMTTTENASTAPQCCSDERRIDEHADRDEEDRREHVAHRPDELLDDLLLARLGDERARDERAERDGVAERKREQRGARSRSRCSRRASSPGGSSARQRARVAEPGAARRQ